MVKSSEELSEIADRIIKWSLAHPRQLPWKATKDPYPTWVSEIILQQTRVQQGLPYFTRFMEAFPTIRHLARANQDEVYAVWSGLGYYRRARHMHEAAKQIVEEMAGEFPTTYAEILTLKGIGPYTAAAIASFSFDLPHAVVDGNVIRVLARLLGMRDPVDKGPGADQIRTTAQSMLPADRAALFNQAIMDFGALQCRPSRPHCEACILRDHCQAYEDELVSEIPVKTKAKPRRHRHFNYIVLTEGDHIYMRRRESDDIWQGLYEFFLIESSEPLGWNDIASRYGLAGEVIGISKIYRQTLSHQEISASFIVLALSDHFDHAWVHGAKRVAKSQASSLACPKIIDCYLGDKSVPLTLGF